MSSFSRNFMPLSRITHAKLLSIFATASALLLLVSCNTKHRARSEANDIDSNGTSAVAATVIESNGARARMDGKDSKEVVPKPSEEPSGIQARLIGDDEIARESYLKNYLGKLVIQNAFVAIVIDGVDQQSSFSAHWSPFITAILIKTAKGWEASKSFQGLFLGSPETLPRSQWRKVGFDFGVDRESQTAFARAVLQDQGEGSGRHPTMDLTLSLAQNLRLITMKLERTQTAARRDGHLLTSYNTPSVTLRVETGFTGFDAPPQFLGVRTGGSPGAKKSGDTQVAQYFVQANGAQLFGILGYNPFRVRSTLGHVDLNITSAPAKNGSRAGTVPSMKNVFELLIGTDAVQSIAVRSEALTKCYNQLHAQMTASTVAVEETVTDPAQCMNQFPYGHPTVDIKNNNKTMMLGISFEDLQGNFWQYAPITERDSVVASLPSASPYRTFVHLADGRKIPLGDTVELKPRQISRSIADSETFPRQDLLGFDNVRDLSRALEEQVGASLTWLATDNTGDTLPTHTVLFGASPEQNTLSVQNAEGQSLSLYPVSPGLLQRWKESESRATSAPMESGTLQALADFQKTAADKAFLIAGCPPPNASLSQYFHDMQTFQPHAWTMFGCVGLGPSWHPFAGTEGHTKTPAPLANVWWGARRGQPSVVTWDLGQTVKNENPSDKAGIELFFGEKNAYFNGGLVIPMKVSLTNRGHKRVVEANLALGTLKGFWPQKVLLVTENGAVAEKTISQDFQQTVEKWFVELPRQDRRARFVLLGRRTQDSESQETLLSATGYLTLSTAHH